MNFKEWLNENESQGILTLGQVANVGTGMEDADFWIQRKGSESTVGRVIRKPEGGPNFTKEYIGVKVRPEWAARILPQYLSYLMEHLWTQGVWRKYARGSTKLMSIRTEDVRQCPIVQ